LLFKDQEKVFFLKQPEFVLKRAGLANLELFQEGGALRFLPRRIVREHLIKWSKLPQGALFWRLQTVGWMLTLPLYYFGMQSVLGLTAQALWMAILRPGLGFVLTALVLRPLYRRIRTSRHSALSSALLAFVLCGLVAYADIHFSALSAWVAFGLEKPLYLYPMPVVGDSAIFMRLMTYVIWSLLYFGILHWRTSLENRLRMLELESANRLAELHSLQYQINPHFLFNALNSIVAQKDEPQAVEEITHNISEYLRLSLKRQQTIAPLGLELDALEYYLRAEKIRFESRLDFRVDATIDAREVSVPSALIQPLLENAIKYGQATSTFPLRISITAQVEEQALIVSVSNSGHWVEPEQSGGTGIGLSNLRRRLALIYSDRAHLSTILQPEEVTMRLVIHQNGQPAPL
jgi:hypothetical protein